MKRDVKFIRSMEHGVVLEDGDYYQAFIKYDEIPQLIAKLSILASVDRKKIPMGSYFHPACIVQEYIDEQQDVKKCKPC